MQNYEELVSEVRYGIRFTDAGPILVPLWKPEWKSSFTQNEKDRLSSILKIASFTFQEGKEAIAKYYRARADKVESQTIYQYFNVDEGGEAEFAEMLINGKMNVS